MLGYSGRMLSTVLAAATAIGIGIMLFDAADC